MLAHTMKKYYIAMAVLAGVSLVAIIWQYAVSRGAAGDERKVSDITTLQMALDDYAEEKGSVPASLSALDLDSPLAKRLNDYEYTHTSDTFTLCATFATDASTDGAYGNYGSTESPYWHKKGRQCFTSEIFTYNKFYENPNTNPSDDFLKDYDFNSFQ